MKKKLVIANFVHLENGTNSSHISAYFLSHTKIKKIFMSDECASRHCAQNTTEEAFYSHSGINISVEWLKGGTDCKRKNVSRELCYVGTRNRFVVSYVSNRLSRSLSCNLLLVKP